MICALIKLSQSPTAVENGSKLRDARMNKGAPLEKTS